MAEQRILIEHPDGRRYAVTPEGVPGRETEGFVVIGPEGGAPVKRGRKARRLTAADVAVAVPGDHVDHQAIAGAANEAKA